MRPKKRVLLVCADEFRMQELTMQLDVWGYRMLRADSEDVALEMLRAYECGEIDVVLVHLPLEGAADVLREAKQLHPYAPTVASYDSARFDDYSWVDVMLARVSAAELRERLKIVAARKRGPHKKPVASVLSLPLVKGLKEA